MPFTIASWNLHSNRNMIDHFCNPVQQLGLSAGYLYSSADKPALLHDVPPTRLGFFLTCPSNHGADYAALTYYFEKAVERLYRKWKQLSSTRSAFWWCGDRNRKPLFLDPEGKKHQWSNAAGTNSRSQIPHHKIRNLLAGGRPWLMGFSLKPMCTLTMERTLSWMVAGLCSRINHVPIPPGWTVSRMTSIFLVENFPAPSLMLIW